MRAVFVAVMAGLALSAAPAHAEVRSASPSVFEIHAESTIQATPEHAWANLGEVGRWWNSAHTFSGDASNLSLDRQAGGCFCERWSDGQSVEHGRVVMVSTYDGVRTLRFIGALGPLQELGATGVMTFTVAPEGEGAKVTMHYRVSGDAGLGLDALAPLVDQVLMEQFGRFDRYTRTGAPS